jgi:hypothetical protein
VRRLRSIPRGRRYRMILAQIRPCRTSAFTKLSQSKSHLVMAMDLQINLYSLNLLSSPCPFM